MPAAIAPRSRRNASIFRLWIFLFKAVSLSPDGFYMKRILRIFFNLDAEIPDMDHAGKENRADADIKDQLFPRKSQSCKCISAEDGGDGAECHGRNDDGESVPEISPVLECLQCL